MRPLRLELEGFTSFRERTEVSFEDTDLFVFRGATGSGKSSLIDAMIFALYGSVPRYDNRTLIAPVISQGKVRARVRLDFEARGRTYSAVRVVQRTTTGATTKEARLEESENGASVKTLAATESELSACVQNDVIGLGLDHFTKCVVLPQGEFAAFLRAKPGERKQLLERLLGLGLYERLRKAANLRWREEENRVANLQWRLESALTHATPEAVREAEKRVATLERLREHIDGVSGRLIELATAIEAAGERWSKGAEQLELLAEVRVPESTSELATRHRQAEQEVRRASEAREAAASSLRAAQAMRDALPERAAVEKVVKQRTDLARLDADIDRTRTELNAAAETAAVAVADDKSAREDLSKAREVLGRLPGKSELEGVREKRKQLAGTEDDAERAGRDLAQAEQAYTAAHGRKSEADRTMEAAARAFEALRVAHSAADMAHHLEEGRPCPVCRQNVAHLPDHDPPEDLDAARERKRVTERAAVQAGAERDRCRSARTACATTLKLRKQSAESLRVSLSEAPTDEEISALMVEIAACEARVERLARRVEEAAGKRAEADGRLRSASATLKQQKAFATNLRADLREAPTPDEAAALLDAISSADGSLRRAGVEEESARRAHEHARRELEKGQTRLDAAWSEYREVRDLVAEMKPPASVEGDLAGSWTRLSEWAGRKYGATQEAMARAGAAREAASSEKDRLDARLRERCGHDGLSLGSEEDPAKRCAEELGAARKGLDDLREAARERERVEEQRKHAHQRALIARDLGNHLNARNFGAWLQNQILAWLAQGATARLRELSSGQYSLDLSGKNEFLVIDHRNADEPRLAKTLSGGETFLASLALALSLAEQVAELAARGSAKLEALFLDEGFGTLDSETLDVVAATIEQLGTERMVGIVTHVSELADRVPVQYRVKKVGNSSSVARVET